MFLQLEGVSFSYPGSGCVLFSDISLSFHEGWTVVAGSNGAGKSTLISIAAGLIVPDSGRVRRSGEIVLCPQVFSGLEGDDWSYIFSGDNHVGMLKSTLSITDEMIEREHELSGGEKRLLSIALALATDPDFLLLDESLSGLDYKGYKALRALLRALKAEGRGVVFIT